MLYRTYFNLEYPVKDFDAAYEYLIEDDMTKYLKGDNRCPDETKINKIEWILEDEQSGHIDLITNQELSPKELDSISDWISGQNSDRIGESFEQKDFACYPESDLYDCDSYHYDDGDYDSFDEEYVMAEFDWKTNPYKLELISDEE